MQKKALKLLSRWNFDIKMKKICNGAACLFDGTKLFQVYVIGSWILHFKFTFFSLNKHFLWWKHLLYLDNKIKYSHVGIIWLGESRNEYLMVAVTTITNFY